MARVLWKGSISFGLVTVPIGLVSAIEAREELAFNLLHKKNGSRIVEKRFCKEEDVEAAGMRGARPGPVMYLGAAIHRDEINRVEIVSTGVDRTHFSDARTSCVIETAHAARTRVTEEGALPWRGQARKSSVISTVR